MAIDDKIVDTREDKNNEADFMEEVRDNFEWANIYEQENLEKGEDDLRQLDGDQWPEIIRRQRIIDRKPMLTINKLPGFVDGVKGDARLNQMQIKVRANHPSTEDQINNKPEELARIFNGLIRQIEQVSNANYARLKALDGGIDNGFGYYRVIADFIDDDTFDQELRTQRIKNQFSCLVDPMHIEPDARDAKWWFISDEIRRKEFKKRYPDVEPSNFQSYYTGTPYDRWFREDMVRVAEYHVKRPFKKKLVAVEKEDGSQETYDAIEWEKISDDLQAKEQIVHISVDEQGQPIEIPGPAPEGSGFEEKVINPMPRVIREREIDSHIVVMYIVDGVQIIDGPRNDSGKIILDFKTQEDIKDKEGKYRKFIWPGKIIPIIPVWGKELQIGNQTKRRSLIRHAKDSQKNFNYHVTAETERTALAKVPPAVLTKQQLGNYGGMWASTQNLKYLLYEPDGRPGAVPPFFPAPPQASSGNTLLIQQATQDMKDTMSIQDASLGVSSGQEISGTAKLAEQRKNDVANFEFTDNLRVAVKLEGDIYVDVIPYYYDTERVLLILNEEGEDEFVKINERVIDEETGEEVILNDMTQGKYLVTVTTGPNFTTQRLETAENLTALASGVNEPLAQLILTSKVVKNMDWPGSDETAEMLEKLLPPGLVEGDEEEQGLQQGQGQDQGQGLEQMTDAAKLQGQLLTNQQKELDIKQKEAEMGVGRQRLQETMDKIEQMLQGQGV